MARVTIDDDVCGKPQFRRLTKLSNNDDDKAMGIYARFKRVAQDYYGKKKLVPIEEIELGDFQPIIDSGFGIIRPEGVYFLDAEQEFDWYLQRCEAAKKGGRPKKEETGSDIPKTEKQIPVIGKDAPKTESDENKNSANPLAPVPAPSPDQLQNKELKANFSNPTQDLECEMDFTPGTTLKLALETQQGLAVPSLAMVPKSKKPENLNASKFVAAYIQAYGDRYEKGGVRPRPALGGKVQGQILNYLKDTPIDRACQAITVYCQMKNTWFETKSHDFTTFTENLNNIYRALDTGSDPAEEKNRTNFDECDFSRPGEAKGI